MIWLLAGLLAVFAIAAFLLPAAVRLELEQRRPEWPPEGKTARRQPGGISTPRHRRSRCIESQL